MAYTEEEKIIDAIVEDHGLAAETRNSYLFEFRRFVRFMGGVGAALNAVPEDVDAWMTELRKRSDKSAYHAAMSVKTVFNHLKEDGIVDWNPFDAATEVPSASVMKEYSASVSIAEAKRILEHAYSVCEDPDATQGRVVVALLAMLHVRYSIPTVAALRLRVGNYYPDSSPAAIVWVKTSTMENCYVEIDGHTAACLDSYLAGRGPLDGDDPLLARVMGKNKGGFYSKGSLSKATIEFYEEAGVHVGRRNFKVAAVRLAAESGASMSQIRNMMGNISVNMAFQAARELDKATLREIQSRMDVEMESEAPIFRGEVSVRSLRFILTAAQKMGSEGVEVVVTHDGRLEFPVVGEYLEFKRGEKQKKLAG